MSVTPVIPHIRINYVTIFDALINFKECFKTKRLLNNALWSDEGIYNFQRSGGCPYGKYHNLSYRSIFRSSRDIVNSAVKVIINSKTKMFCALWEESMIEYE